MTDNLARQPNNHSFSGRESNEAGKADMCKNHKLFRLKAAKLFHNCTRGFLYKISLFFVIFSGLVSLFLLIPGLFDRTPAFSYLIKKLTLPITYEMQGSIQVVDCEGNTLNSGVTIYVGGYSEAIDSSEEYNLVFSSSSTERFFAVIVYKDQYGRENISIEEISFPEDDHIIKKDFIING